MSTSQPATQFPIPSIVQRFNPIVRRLLAIGIPMGPNVLITVRGRKSGTPYTFPVATLRVDGREYLFSPFGEVQWVHNLRAAGEATIRRGRHDRRMTAVQISPDVAAPILERNYLIGGQPGQGKSSAGRTLCLGCVLDPTVEQMQE